MFKKFRDMLKTERAMPLDIVREKVYEQLEFLMLMEVIRDYPYFGGLFLDDNEYYAVYFEGGSAYRLDFTVSNGDVLFQPPVKIEVIHTPVTNTRASIYRLGGEDDKWYWYGIAASSVINRVGEIDSTLLFDSFVEDFDDYEHEVELRFYHEKSSKLVLGKVTAIQRVNHLLLACGEIDKDHPIANEIANSIESGEYGLSIGYTPTKKAEKIRITDDIEIPSYDEGVLIEISFVKEAEAASHFTNLNK